ncbi:MAG: hypothetical protein IKM48_07840 [Clostridia bacterium]|nr:hypothetical protein [Clostridia bacterium]
MNKIAVFFRKYGHKLLTFMIGLVFLAFCAFMLVLGINRVYHMFKPANIYLENVDPDLIWAGAAFDEVRAAEMEEGSADYFQLYIANFVRQDFPGFTSPLGLDTDYFVSFGIWQAIKVNGQGVYNMKEDGSFLIPKADVEKYARYSFDYPGKITHRDVDICGNFNYDSLSGCYKVGSDAMNATYLVPKILDVKFDEETNLYTISVDCYYQEGLSEEDATKDPTKFAKRLSITVQKVEEVMTINDAETTVTNYLFNSCALVDETVTESNTSK